MKFAYFGFPHTGGTYTVYRHLRDGLRSCGIEVRWAGLGKRANQVASDPQWVHEFVDGEVVGADCVVDKKLAELFVKYLIEEQFDGVFVNVLANRVQTNIVRYLPENIRRVMIVHTITPAAYAAAHSVRDFVHATVGVSPRIKNDLMAHYGFHPHRTFSIPNGIDLANYLGLTRGESTKNIPLRLVSIGRIEDSAKGVFWLPKILSKLDDVDYCLTIIGDGPDLDKLKVQCQKYEKRVVFAGRVSSAEVPTILSSQDVLLFPSRFEGLPLTLVEAQASGCVPIASQIRGVTDFVVVHGEDGFLFPVGDCRLAAKYVRTLAYDRPLLNRMSAQTQKAVADRFSQEQMTQRYARVLTHSMHTSLQKSPLSLDEWSFPKEMRPGLRSTLPLPLKNFLRVARERLVK